MRAVSVMLAVYAGNLLSSNPAFAQDVDGNGRHEEPRLAAPERSAPKEHFEQALVHYRAGRYRAASAELRAALVLDPESKDLFYNLALVHEKLGELDLAIEALQSYITLEVDPNEVQRAEQAILRMRGARAELKRSITQVTPVAALPARESAPEPPRSRVDGLLIATSTVAVAAAVIGTVFGVRALVLSPGSDPSTNRSTSVEELRAERRRAKTSALIADLGFAVSLVAGGASAALWFSRAPCAPPAVADARWGLSWGASF